MVVVVFLFFLSLVNAAVLHIDDISSCILFKLEVLPLMAQNVHEEIIFIVSMRSGTKAYVC